MAVRNSQEEIGSGAASADIGGAAAPSGAIRSTGPDAAVSIGIAGRAMLPGGREFACTARQVSLAAVEIVAEVKVDTGQIVICYLDGVGLLPGKVVKVTQDGFVMALQLAEAQRSRIAGRLEWHTNRAIRTAQLRAAPRIVPIHTSVAVRLGERIVLSGRILNISISGAAIELSTANLPFVGARVRVGGRFARVIRLLETGIAVQFDEPFFADHFDERVRP